MTHNGQFCHQSGSDWLKMAHFGQFSTFPRFFPKKMAHIDSEWPISPNLQLFKFFPTKSTHFWPNLKFGGGGVHWPNFP